MTNSSHFQNCQRSTIPDGNKIAKDLPYLMVTILLFKIKHQELMEGYMMSLILRNRYRIFLSAFLNLFAEQQAKLSNAEKEHKRLILSETKCIQD